MWIKVHGIDSDIISLRHTACISSETMILVAEIYCMLNRLYIYIDRTVLGTLL
jgi:hypothetical protein